MTQAQILIVEDERIVAEGIQRSLKDLGYGVSAIVSTGAMAVLKAQENNPDLVLMDIMLKGDMDGIEAASQIHARYSIPVVYLTAYADERVLERAKKAEPFGYIIKPFKDNELHAAIKMALYKHQMEKKLKESEAWFSTTLKSIGDGVIATDIKGDVTLMNPIAESLTGWEQEEAQGRPLEDVFNIVNEETGKEVENPVTKVLREDMVVGLANHTLLITKGGTEIPIDDSGAPIRDEKGDMIGVVLIFRDVSEKRKAEKALRASEESYRTLFREMISGFARNEIICDSEGRPINSRYLDINPAFERIVGLKSEDVVGKTILDVFPSLEPYWMEKFGRVALTGEPEHFEATAAETGLWFDVMAFRPSSNQYACTFTDITERKMAEEEREKLRAQLSNAMEMAHLGHWEYDVANDLFTFNDHFYKIFRTTAKQIGGYTMSAVEYARHFVHPGDIHVVEEETRKAIEATDLHFSQRLEHRMLYADGTVGHISVRFFIVKDAKGLTVKTYGVNQDITEYKKLEAQLLQAQKMESIGTLAGGIAHDFNNILFPMMGFAEMALDDIPKGSPLRDNIKEILQGTKRAGDLVKQILAFSRQSDQKPKPLKVQLVVKEVLKLIRSSIPTTIEIKQDISNKCGLVTADPTQIHQVAMNLTTNAYQAMEDEGGVLEVTLKEVALGVDDLTDPSMTPGTYVCLSVADTGIGMDQSTTDRIFEPYFSTKENGKGTGLGLAVVHGIVKRNQGDIRVYSEPGKGTAFHVYLPVIKSQVETEKTQAIEPVSKGTERILLVDDEDSIVRMEKQMLERLGYDVTERTSSVEALEAFRNAPDKFDLVITDMTMPNMTGVQLASKLLEIRPDVPIIICTGFSTKIDGEKAKAAGIRGFVMKPVIMSELAKKIREVLDQD